MDECILSEEMHNWFVSVCSRMWYSCLSRTVVPFVRDKAGTVIVLCL